MTGDGRRSWFATALSLSFLGAWWLLWYPWGGSPVTPQLLYAEGWRECGSRVWYDSLLCTLQSTSFVNGQFRPSQSWFYALFLDPWELTVEGTWLQYVLIGNWIMVLIGLYHWLRTFQLPGHARLLASAVIGGTGSLVWYSAGSANADPLALSISLGLALLWRLRLRHWRWIELPVSVLVLGFLAGMSNTARLVALAILATTVWESRTVAPRRWLVYLGYFVVLFSAAELVEIGRRDWSAPPIRTGRFALALLGFAAMPYGAYLGTIFLPHRWRWPGLVAVTAGILMTSPSYDFDFAKGDTLYLPTDRLALVVVSFSYAMVRALSIARLVSLGVFAVANLALILVAELVTGTAQIDPNPRNFLAIQLFVPLAAVMWVMGHWRRTQVLHRVGLALAVLATGVHSLALTAIHFDSLTVAVKLESEERRLADFAQTCSAPSSRYSNVYLGRSLMLYAETCRQEWVIAKSRPADIAEDWWPIGPAWSYYRMTFGANEPFGAMGRLQMPAIPTEWIDIIRSLPDHHVSYGLVAYPTEPLRRPLSRSESETVINQMRKPR